MNSPRQGRADTAQGSSEAGSERQASGAANSTGRSAEDRERAALGPIPKAVSAAGNPAPARPADSPVEAQGRRTLSTAFVMEGPDRHLTVELRDGRVLVLRNVVMRPKDYCGVQVLGGAAGRQYCGGYAEVAAARPGGGPTLAGPDLVVSDPAEAPRPGERN